MNKNQKKGQVVNIEDYREKKKKDIEKLIKKVYGERHASKFTELYKDIKPFIQYSEKEWQELPVSDMNKSITLSETYDKIRKNKRHDLFDLTPLYDEIQELNDWDPLF